MVPLEPLCSCIEIILHHNDSDETHGYESLRLSRVHWISDGLPRFCHVACVISKASNVIRWILIWRFGCLFVGFNLNRYYSFDQRLQLNYFKNNSPTSKNVSCYPLPPSPP